MSEHEKNTEQPPAPAPEARPPRQARVARPPPRPAPDPEEVPELLGERSDYPLPRGDD